MTDAVIHQGMDIETFIRLSDSGERFELIDGEKVPVSPTVLIHMKVLNRIALRLGHFTEVNQLGAVFAEGTFILKEPDNPDWVKDSRIPDVMFIKADRMTAYEADNDENRPLSLVPDLAVEVMSPNDTLAEAKRKAALYLNDGVLVVWVIDPERRAIYIYQPDTDPTAPLTEDDTLSGGEVILGFEIKVSQLFE